MSIKNEADALAHLRKMARIAEHTRGGAMQTNHADTFAIATDNFDALTFAIKAMEEQRK